MKNKSVVIVSSGQPSLNPRLVKEADTLTTAGYRVTVIYAYWNDWGTLHDKQLLAGKKWKAILVGGSPWENKAVYFFSRLLYKTAKAILKRTGSFALLANLATSRSSYFLLKEVEKHKADLYIGHNLGALPAVVEAAKRHHAKCGFDAEDFHRQEISDDTVSFHYRLSKTIEDNYLPCVHYLTASSLLIAESYNRLYHRDLITLLNVFPKTDLTLAMNTNDPLKLFWFSQTIGPNRGLEIIIEAMGLSNVSLELHLLGNINDAYKRQLFQQAESTGILPGKLNFYRPVTSDRIFQFAALFDIGLASETGFCINNNIALSNKLFTYLQSGLAVAASNTPAQGAIMRKYPKTGNIYNNAGELAAIFDCYSANRELLLQTKKAAYQIGQTELNWEMESKKFLEIIDKTLNSR